METKAVMRVREVGAQERERERKHENTKVLFEWFRECARLPFNGRVERYERERERERVEQ